MAMYYSEMYRLCVMAYPLHIFNNKLHFIQKGR